MNIRARVERLEAAAANDVDCWDLTQLTDPELDALLSCFTEATQRGAPVQLTPEVAAALERVRKW